MSGTYIVGSVWPMQSLVAASAGGWHAGGWHAVVGTAGGWHGRRPVGMAGSRFVALRKKDCSPAKTVLHDVRSLGRCNSSRRSYQFRSSRSLRRRLTCGRTPRGCSSMVRVPAFQAGHAGSIPVTRSTFAQVRRACAPLRGRTLADGNGRSACWTCLLASNTSLFTYQRVRTRLDRDQFRGTSGDVTIKLHYVIHRDSGVFEATVTYVIGDQSWSQAFEAMIINDDELRSLPIRWSCRQKREAH